MFSKYDNVQEQRKRTTCEMTQKTPNDVKLLLFIWGKPEYSLIAKHLGVILLKFQEKIYCI